MTPLLRPSNQSTTVEQLGEAIADIAASIHAAVYQLLVLLREFDDREGWNTGFHSCAHWLSWRTGIEMGAAREKVRVARAIPNLPLLAAALQRGEISYAKVRALTRIATPENEVKLLAVAHHGTAAQVERLVRAWRWCDRREEDRNYISRSATCYVDEDGMVILRARLTPEQGAVVQRALEAASDQLYQESREAAPPDRIEQEVTWDQRQADALALMAQAALNRDVNRGTAGDRYQVVLHVETANAITNRVHHVVELNDGGIGVSAETSRRLSCDASVLVMQEDADGAVLDVGRKTRTVPTRIRRALTARDGGCVFPGCAARRCDAHHVVHWMDGGRTSLDNLMLLCPRHHTWVHEGGIAVERNEGGEVIFRRPDGRCIELVPPSAWSGKRVVPGGASGRLLRCWDGTPFNVGYAIDVLRPQPPTQSDSADRQVP